MIDRSIVCAYLYVISRYGYPPPAENTGIYLEQMKALGFRSVELEGIRREHLLQLYDQRGAINWEVFFETLDLIGFKGVIGLDIGGVESDVGDIDAAYREGAKWLEGCRDGS